MNSRWTPAVTKESHNGTREIQLYSELLSNRNIFLQGEINQETANEFLTQFLYLTSQSTEEIKLFINSPGGEITSGLVIYDLIQSSPAPIKLYCTGTAASMAAIILAGGQKGNRYILPHSQVMIHEPRIAGGMGGSASSIKNIADSILQTRKLINEILSKHTGKTVKEIEKSTSFDNYLSAEEAVKFGLCDQIIPGFF
ncbi:MAG: ClpP family protease [Lachnospiraceae bacterium]